jgi:hypothetical protein
VSDPVRDMSGKGSRRYPEPRCSICVYLTWRRVRYLRVMGTDIKADFNHLLADVRMHDPGERAAVLQAYLKLVDRIATHRDERMALEDSRHLQKDR